MPIEYTNVTKTEKTSAADFILEVRGDSMQPKFFDGDCVLVKQTNSIYEEEIGVFILNNESYIKKWAEKSLFHSILPMNLLNCLNMMTSAAPERLSAQLNCKNIHLHCIFIHMPN